MIVSKIIYQKLLKIHVLYWFAFALLTAVYKSWLVITPESFRGYVVVFCLLAVLFIGLAVSLGRGGDKASGRLLWWLILADITLATFLVYTQRGMASRAVALYAVPLAVSALYGGRRQIFVTAAASAAAYWGAVWAYNVFHPFESYLAEIIGTAGFYGLGMFLVACVLSLKQKD